MVTRTQALASRVVDSFVSSGCLQLCIRSSNSGSYHCDSGFSLASSSAKARRAARFLSPKIRLRHVPSYPLVVSSLLLRHCAPVSPRVWQGPACPLHASNVPRFPSSPLANLLDGDGICRK